MIKVIRFFSVTIGLLFGASALYANPFSSLIKAYPYQTLIEKSKKDADIYQLVLGPMEYREAQLDGEQEGYAPARQQEIYGEVIQTVFDHSNLDSAKLLNERMLKRIEQDGFEVLFHCDRTACGDVQGWALYISNHIAGDDDRQFYTVAKHPSSVGGDWYLVYYISDIGSQPRTIIDLIHTGVQPDRRIAFDQTRLGDKLVQDGKFTLPNVLFGLNSATMTEAAYAALDEVAKSLKQHSNLSLYVVGHTDDTGTLEYNMQLSQQRAKAVADYLMKAGGVQAERLLTKGLGPLSPVVVGRTEEARSQNRRVELIVR